MIKEATLKEFVETSRKATNRPYEQHKIIWRKGELKKRRGPVLDFHVMLEERLNNIFIACFRIRKNDIKSFKELFLYKIGFKQKIKAFEKFFPLLSKTKNKREKTVSTLLRGFNQLRNDIAHHPFEEERCKYGNFGNIVKAKAFKILKEDFAFLEEELTDIESDVQDYFASQR